MTLCFIKLIRHIITCGTAHVTVYIILMSTTLHSQILSFYDLLYTAFNTDGLFKLNTKKIMLTFCHILLAMYLLMKTKKHYKLKCHYTVNQLTFYSKNVHKEYNTQQQSDKMFYAVFQNKPTPKTGWCNFIKIGPLLIIFFHRMHWHLIANWLRLKSLTWIECQLRGFNGNNSTMQEHIYKKPIRDLNWSHEWLWCGLTSNWPSLTGPIPVEKTSSGICQD